MKPNTLFFSLLAFSLLAGSFMAFTPAPNAPSELTPGSPAPVFSLPATNGQEVSFESEQYADAKGFIVVFTCNHCPYAKKYEQEIIDLHNTYAERGFPVIAISSNDAKKLPEDSFENMKKLAKKHKYPFPYAYDESQEVAHAYGAEKTPHVFIVTRAGQDYTLRYVGGIDNKPNDPASSTKEYAAQAVEDLLAGREVQTPQTRAVGCGIKWS